MRVSLTALAESELVEGGLYYARQANAELGLACISEFERSIKLLLTHIRNSARSGVGRPSVYRFAGFPTASFTNFAKQKSA